MVGPVAGSSAAGPTRSSPAQGVHVARKRCPNCGKRVPDYEPCCPRCGYSIPIVFEASQTENGPLLEDDEEWSDYSDGEIDETDHVIDDPELLERAEAFVRGLPLYELAGLVGSYEEGAPRDYTLFPEGTRSDDGLSLPETKPPVRGKSKESASAGGECPSCGRQAQKGWGTCPWCGFPLES